MSKYNNLFISTTDTVLGLGAPISTENANLIFELKQRSKTKPLVIMIASLQDARKFNDWNDKAEILAQKYWPGPTTLVLSPNLALRIPNSQGLISLIKKLGPIYMTSCNLSSQPPLTFAQAKKVFHKQITNFYNFGQGTGKPSTLIRVEDGKVLR